MSKTIPILIFPQNTYSIKSYIYEVLLVKTDIIKDFTYKTS